MTRFVYIIPLNEQNCDAETLAFWSRQGTLFEVAVIDGDLVYDSVFCATRAEAVQVAREYANDLGWQDGSYQLSFDE